MDVLRPLDMFTRRLVLIAITPASLRSELSKDGRLGEITDAVVSADWPPQHWEPHVFELLLKRFEADSGEVGWHRYIAWRSEDDEERTLIGMLGGFRQADTRECEIGYSVILPFRRRGVATEGMRTFLSWAFAHPNVEAAVAQTDPTLISSIRVMEKLDMTHVGAGREPGTLLYRLNR